MDYLIFSAMRRRKSHLFCTSSHHNVPYEKQQELNRGLSLEMRILAGEGGQLLNMLYISTHLSVPHGKKHLEDGSIYIQIGTIFGLS